VRNGRSKIFQQDIVDVLDKQLLEGMGVLITEDEQKKCEERVCLSLIVILTGINIVKHSVLNLLRYYRYLSKKRDCLLYMKPVILCLLTYFLGLTGMHFRSSCPVVRYNMISSHSNTRYDDILLLSLWRCMNFCST
jgi:hypothetical protein